MEKVFKATQHWLADRPTLSANNTPHRLLTRLLIDEARELHEAWQKWEGIDDIAQEAADVILFILQFLVQTGQGLPRSDRYECMQNMDEIAEAVLWDATTLANYAHSLSEEAIASHAEIPKIILSIYCMITQLLQALEISPELCVMEKMALNLIRYPAIAFQDEKEAYTESMKKCREYVKAHNVKAEFYTETSSMLLQ